MLGENFELLKKFGVYQLAPNMADRDVRFLDPGGPFRRNQYRSIAQRRQLLTSGSG